MVLWLVGSVDFVGSLLGGARYRDKTCCLSALPPQGGKDVRVPLDAPHRCLFFVEKFFAWVSGQVKSILGIPPELSYIYIHFMPEY
jgi:hypothetical protein